VRYLNPTLGGYLNKILSFWLIKRPEQFLNYVISKKGFVQALFNHLYLTQCVTDLLVRLCTVPDIKRVNKADYHELRNDIIQCSLNALDTHNESDFMTEQLFDLLTGITKKCYLMFQPRQFFDELMSPFVFLLLLEFTFEGGAHTSQGSDFFKLFFYNLFVAEPHEAVIDIMEINFGFDTSTSAETGRQVSAKLSAIEPSFPASCGSQEESKKGSPAGGGTPVGA